MNCFIRSVCFSLAAGLVFAAESALWAQYTTSATFANIPTVGPGGTIPIQCSVTNNNDPETTNFKVAAEVVATANTPRTDINGGFPLFLTILPNNPPGTVVFNFTVPSGWPTGAYSVHSVVRRNQVLANGQFDETEVGEGFGNFTVGANPAFTGRIAYQVYSSFLAPPPLNSIDGTIQLYTLPSSSPINITGSLVENAVNPKFSPDGSKIVFAGIPFGAALGTHNSLAVFLYDFADNTLTQLTSNPNGKSPGEDPNFSPDGKQIVYKYTPSSSLPGQLWIMNLDGSGQTQLTSTTDEHSGPCFSPTGNAIAYYTGGSTDLGGSAAEAIWTVPYPVTTPVEIIADNMESFYPNYQDTNTIFFTQWVASGGAETEILAYTISSNTSLPLATNMAGPTPNDSGYSDADPFPVDQTGNTLVGFSSARPQPNTGPQGNNKGGDIVYLGDTSSGAVYYLPNLDPNINSSTTLSALGGTYTPYSFARKLVMTTPGNGAILTAGTTVVVEVEAWSNGANWIAASPMVTFKGAGITQTVTLHDEGIRGNQGTGGELYSASVTLPQTTGAYTLSVIADSMDNGLTNVITSSSLTVQPSTAVPAAPRWMLILLVPLFGFTALRALQTRRA